MKNDFCKIIVLLGEKLTPHDSRIPLLNWIKNKFWFPEYVTTIDMQYGIQQEPKDILAYTKVKDVPVIISGLWINKMYPHLGARPLWFNYGSRKYNKTMWYYRGEVFENS